MRNNIEASRRMPSLRRRLNLLLLIAFLPVIFALCADAALSYRHALEEARRATVDEASVAAAHQERHQAYLRALLATLASEYRDLPPAAQSCGPRLQALLSTLNKFANIGLLDARGRHVCSALPGHPDKSFEDRLYFREARDGRDLSLGELTVGALSGKRVLIFGYPLTGSDDVFNGVVFAAFKDRQFASLPLEKERDMNSRLAYFDRNGRFIVTDPAGLPMVAGDLAPALLAKLRSGASVTSAFEAMGTDGRVRIAAVGAVHGTASQPVAFVRATVDKGEVLAGWRAAVMHKVVGLALAMLCCVIVARCLLEKWLVRDLRKLVAFTSAIRQGLAPAAPGPANTMETGIALNSAAAMAETLRRQRAELLQAHAQLSSANAELEQRVQDRTRELQRSERLYRALAEAIPQMVWSGTVEKGVTYVNKAWRTSLGASAPEQAIGHGWADYLHPDDRERAWKLWEAAAAENSVFSGQFRIRCIDGQYRHFMLRSAPLIGADGKVDMWAGVGTDITELKKTEDALRRANDELQTFSYSVSHDLRAPLIAIDGYAGLLLSDFGAGMPEQARHFLQRISASGRHMNALIDDLLKLGQVSAAELAPLPSDFSGICEEVAAALHETGGGREIEIDIEPGMRVLADARLLRVAVSNLLGNAWKFTRGANPARIAVGCLRRENETVYYVKDNGVGFDMRHADKLFGVFQRLHSKRDFPGTGIGLATVRRVIARHGGRIWAEASPNEGAAFYFTLGTKAGADGMHEETERKPQHGCS